MKKSLLPALALILTITPSLFAQTGTSSTAPIPEEARRHFVIGTTLFKDAKTPADYVQVENEFKQAADLAPQWPDARYNLALAEEAAGHFIGAMDDLKIYQQFKLTDDDARKAQDKIYVLEAKRQEAKSKQAADQQAADSEAARIKAQEPHFEGRWDCNTGYSVVRGFIVINGPYSAEIGDGFLVPQSSSQVTVHGSSKLSRFSISGRHVTFTVTEDDAETFPQYKNGELDRHNVFDFDLILSEDGNRLAGNVVNHDTASTDSGTTTFPPDTFDATCSRH